MSWQIRKAMLSKSSKIFILTDALILLNNMLKSLEAYQDIWKKR